MNRRICTAVSTIDEPHRIDQGEAWNRWRDELAMGLHGDPLELPTPGSTPSSSRPWWDQRTHGVHQPGTAAPHRAPTDHIVSHGPEALAVRAMR